MVQKAASSFMYSSSTPAMKFIPWQWRQAASGKECCNAVFCSRTHLTIADVRVAGGYRTKKASENIQCTFFLEHRMAYMYVAKHRGMQVTHALHTMKPLPAAAQQPHLGKFYQCPCLY